MSSLQRKNRRWHEVKVGYLSHLRMDETVFIQSSTFARKIARDDNRFFIYPYSSFTLYPRQFRVIHLCVQSHFKVFFPTSWNFSWRLDSWSVFCSELPWLSTLPTGKPVLLTTTETLEQQRPTLKEARLGKYRYSQRRGSLSWIRNRFASPHYLWW